MLSTFPFNKRVLLFVFIVLFSQQTWAHSMGISVTNLRYSSETLKLSTRICYGDFLYEFQKYSKVKNKDYAKKGIDSNDKKDFTNYITNNLRIWVNNVEIHFKTLNINLEQHDEDAFILVVDLSYKVKKLAAAKIKIRNTILLNSIGEQKHLINFYLKDPTTVSHGIETLDKSNPECEFVNE